MIWGRKTRRLIIGIVLFLILWVTVKIVLNSKVIGMFHHPGLQGELLFQENIISNFKKGNLLKHFNTDFLNYPLGENLGFTVANSLHLLLYIPLRLFFTTLESYNALVIIVFALNFIAAYLLAKYLFSFRAAAFCAALVFSLNPYTLLKMNMGFVQKSVLFWIPLYFLAVLKLYKKRSWKYVFVIAIILGLMQFTYPPYAYCVVIATIFLLLSVCRNLKQIKFVLSRLGLIIVMYVSLTSLIYYVMGFGFVYAYMGKIQSAVAAIDGCFNLFCPFWFFPYKSAYYPRELPLGISVSAFILGIIALSKNKGFCRLLWVYLIVFIIIAAGPFIKILNKQIILPYYWLTKYLPFAGGISFPIRFFPFINICLALLAAAGVIALGSIFKKLKMSLIAGCFIIVYLIEQIILFSAVFPPKITVVEGILFHNCLKNEKFEAILNWPHLLDRKIVNFYGCSAALSGKKMVNPYFKNKLPFSVPEFSAPDSLKQEFIETLCRHSVGCVVVHKKFLNGSKDAESYADMSWLKFFCEVKEFPEDNIVVYKITSGNLTRGVDNINDNSFLSQILQ